MVTGALAASYYGRARTTLDLDVVVNIRREQLARLVKALRKAHLNVEEERLLAVWKSRYRIARIDDSKSPHSLDIIFADRKLERKAGRVLNIQHTIKLPSLGTHEAKNAQENDRTGKSCNRQRECQSDTWHEAD